VHIGEKQTRILTPSPKTNPSGHFSSAFIKNSGAFGVPAETYGAKQKGKNSDTPNKKILPKLSPLE